MRYFVTGATGFIGKALAKELLKHGHEVVILARTPEKAAELKALGAEVYKGDITERETMRAPMTGVDGVFHVAGWYKIGLRDTSGGQAINVEGTRNVLSMMQELAIPKGVYTSTIAIYSDTHGIEVDESFQFNGEHIAVYNRTKADAHKVADEFIAHGLPLVIVQPGLVYGPGDEGPGHDTFQMWLKGQLPMLVSSTAFTWCHVDDIVEGHLLAMEKGRIGESYIIGGESMKLTEAMKIASEITGVKLPLMTLPGGLVRSFGAIMGIVEKAFPVPLIFTSEYLRVGAATYLGSSAKARRELGYQPRPVREGFIETMRWEMEQAGRRT